MRSHPRLILVEERNGGIGVEMKSTFGHHAGRRHFRLLPRFRREETVAGVVDQRPGHRVTFHRLEDHLVANFCDADLAVKTKFLRQADRLAAAVREGFAVAPAAHPSMVDTLCRFHTVPARQLLRISAGTIAGVPALR